MATLTTLLAQDYRRLPLSYRSSPISPVSPIPWDLGVSGIYSTTLRWRKFRMRAGFHPTFPQEFPCDAAMFKAEPSHGPSNSCGLTKPGVWPGVTQADVESLGSCGQHFVCSILLFSGTQVCEV